MAETLNDIKIIEERVWNASKNRGEKYQYRYINMKDKDITYTGTAAK